MKVGGSKVQLRRQKFLVGKFFFTQEIGKTERRLHSKLAVSPFYHFCVELFIVKQENTHPKGLYVKSSKKLSKNWTPWELNPRPFTCEAKIIPLDQAPNHTSTQKLYYFIVIFNFSTPTDADFLCAC